MSSARPSLAPFCYGRCSSFNSTGALCKKCPFGRDCAFKVMLNLAEINETLDVVDLMKRTQSFLDRYGVERKAPIKSKSGAKMRFATSLTEVEVPQFVEALPVKSKMLAKALIKSGINMQLDARQGVNSFDSSFRPTYMRKVQDLLINGQFTTDELKLAISSEASLSQQALRNAASTVVRTMKELGFIQSCGNKFEATPQSLYNGNHYAPSSQYKIRL